MKKNIENVKLLYASFGPLGGKRFFSLTYLDILALKSVKQIEGHRWEKLCKSV